MLESRHPWHAVQMACSTLHSPREKQGLGHGQGVTPWISAQPQAWSYCTSYCTQPLWKHYFRYSVWTLSHPHNPKRCPNGVKRKRDQSAGKRSYPTWYITPQKQFCTQKFFYSFSKNKRYYFFLHILLQIEINWNRVVKDLVSLQYQLYNLSHRTAMNLGKKVMENIFSWM